MASHRGGGVLRHDRRLHPHLRRLRRAGQADVAAGCPRRDAGAFLCDPLVPATSRSRRTSPSRIRAELRLPGLAIGAGAVEASRRQGMEAGGGEGALRAHRPVAPGRMPE